MAAVHDADGARPDPAGRSRASAPRAPQRIAGVAPPSARSCSGAQRAAAGGRAQ